MQNSKRTNLFITFEGGEGSGKSTQIDELLSFLNSQGHSCLKTREPGGTKLAETLRGFLASEEFNIDPLTEAYLFATSRCHHVRSLIAPALEKGQSVLCDRFFDASMAYQGRGRKLGFSTIQRLNQMALADLCPDRIYLLDIDPKVGLERVSKRQDGEFDRLESEAIEFHQNIRNAYLELAERSPELYCIVDATLPPNEVTPIIKQDISKLL